jgi:hypothetical protein
MCQFIITLNEIVVENKGYNSMDENKYIFMGKCGISSSSERAPSDGSSHFAEEINCENMICHG